MKKTGRFYLDNEKDMIVDLYMKKEEMFYVLRTPNHHSGNLIRNLARLCELPLTMDKNNYMIIEGKIPCYINAYNQKMYIFRLGNTKVANIYPDGSVEMKASIPSISKTLMSQTKNYQLDIARTIVKAYILDECKFHTDLHTHMNANLPADVLIALGIFHQIRYPYYYIKKLHLKITEKQKEQLEKQRLQVEKEYSDSQLSGKYLERRIDDNTFINFADLILNNIENAAYNIPLIRASLAVLKDGQAVFSNLEKVYLYRYVFTKGIPSDKKIRLIHTDQIPDEDIRLALREMIYDQKKPEYANNTLFQNKLLWTAREYRKYGIRYVEISDTTLVKPLQSVEMLEQVHAIMPHIRKETGVMIRFLAAIRRIPLTIIKDSIDEDYFAENLRVLRAVAQDPYVAGSDIVGEEINDITELKPVIREIVKIAERIPSFVVRIHAGENDSLKDNVANSIRCVRESLNKGQRMPQIRIGHGLYTANLKNAKGKELMGELKAAGAVLEFQITSNVRLNNLNQLETHPLKTYLQAGIKCVQGTDGGALYGTNCIDEQLSLEKLLNLSADEMKQMCKTEAEIIQKAKKAFIRKEEKLNHLLEGRTMREYYLSEMEHRIRFDTAWLYGKEKKKAETELAEQIVPLMENRMPIILAGGSFNNDNHRTVLRQEEKELIQNLLDRCDPKKVFFVVGHEMSGYEKFLCDENRGRFQIYAFVPTLLSSAQVQRLKKANVRIRISIEPIGLGTYKSFTYEIFKHMNSVLIALDGNSAGANLIQEAKNGICTCRIFVSPHSRSLLEKAKSLQGYAEVMSDPKTALSHVMKVISG